MATRKLVLTGVLSPEECVRFAAGKVEEADDEKIQNLTKNHSASDFPADFGNTLRTWSIPILDVVDMGPEKATTGGKPLHTKRNNNKKSFRSSKGNDDSVDAFVVHESDSDNEEEMTRLYTNAKPTTDKTHDPHAMCNDGSSTTRSFHKSNYGRKEQPPEPRAQSTPQANSRQRRGHTIVLDDFLPKDSAKPGRPKDRRRRGRQNGAATPDRSSTPDKQPAFNASLISNEEFPSLGQSSSSPGSTSLTRSRTSTPGSSFDSSTTSPAREISGVQQQKSDQFPNLMTERLTKVPSRAPLSPCQPKATGSAPPWGVTPVKSAKGARRVSVTPLCRASGGEVVIPERTPSQASPVAEPKMEATCLGSPVNTLLVVESNLNPQSPQCLKQDQLVNPGEDCNPGNGDGSSSAQLQNEDSKEPDPEKVTHKKTLGIYIQLYSLTLNEHLFVSVAAEIYYLCQLLTTRSFQYKDVAADVDETLPIEERNYMCTIHNTMYFVVNALFNLKELLKKCDRPTIKFLAENERIRLFRPDLHQEMKAALENADDTASSSSANLSSTFLATIQTESCSRQHFPSNNSFIAMKKIKDKFSDILRKWESRHNHIDWGLQNLSRDIKGLLAEADVCCYVHFARLFVGYIFEICEDEKVEDVEKELESWWESTRSFRLHERFRKPGCDGPSPPPVFRGRQRFFAEFIEVADNPKLNRHLMDVLRTQINQLNSKQFGMKVLTSEPSTDPEASDADQAASDVSEEIKSEQQKFKACAVTLKIFAKFLGHIHFLAYSDTENLPLDSQSDVIAQRQLTPLPMDLVGLLQRALKEDHVPLTVPWIAEFLAMMDGVAPNTDPFRQILADLRQLLRLMGSELRSHGYRYDWLLVATSLGWLFQQPSLDGYYFSGEPSPSYQSSIGAVPPMEKLKDLVSRDMLYTVCPYFGEVKYMFIAFTQSGHQVETVPRPINPRPPRSATAPAPKRVDLKEAENKKIQYELMENCLERVVPKRVHTTIEQVSDIVYHNVIGFLKTEVLDPALAPSPLTLMNSTPMEAHERTLRVEKKIQKTVEE
ncbi:uncharacterized protein LOC143281371 [Babylonia areolata]|uniref:uncharacterized protein LOC143281371 n=1 Tax=Babylonia areolata TaxID=304850 RepID=UPI003FD08A77